MYTNENDKICFYLWSDTDSNWYDILIGTVLAVMESRAGVLADKMKRTIGEHQSQTCNWNFHPKIIKDINVGYYIRLCDCFTHFINCWKVPREQI